jgi:hypothetical protein
VTPELQAFVERLERVENQIHRLKLAGLVVFVVVLLISFGLVKGQRGSNRTVEAEKFLLRDSRGTQRAVLEVGEEGSYLELYDASGRPQIHLGGDPKGTSLHFVSEGKIQALMGMSSTGPSLELNDANGIQRVSLEILENEPSLVMLNKDGRVLWSAP